MNLPEDRGEDCKGMIINLIQNDLKIDVTNVRFHAVHRVGKPTVGKSRPIIARFMCREVKDVVKKKRCEKFHTLSECLHYAGLCESHSVGNVALQLHADLSVSLRDG